MLNKKDYQRDLVLSRGLFSTPPCSWKFSLRAERVFCQNVSYRAEALSVVDVLLIQRAVLALLVQKGWRDPCLSVRNLWWNLLGRSWSLENPDLTGRVTGIEFMWKILNKKQPVQVTAGYIALCLKMEGMAIYHAAFPRHYITVYI